MHSHCSSMVILHFSLPHIFQFSFLEGDELLYKVHGGWSRILFLLAHELPQELCRFKIVINLYLYYFLMLNKQHQALLLFAWVFGVVLNMYAYLYFLFQDMKLNILKCKINFHGLHVGRCFSTSTRGILCSFTRLHLRSLSNYDSLSLQKLQTNFEAGIVN